MEERNTKHHHHHQVQTQRSVRVQLSRLSKLMILVLTCSAHSVEYGTADVVMDKIICLSLHFSLTGLPRYYSSITQLHEDINLQHSFLNCLAALSWSNSITCFQAGFIDQNEPVAKVRPGDFESAAKRACQTKLEDAKSIYPRVDESNLPYICMDLVYQHALLVVGFGE